MVHLPAGPKHEIYRPTSPESHGITLTKTSENTTTKSIPHFHTVNARFDYESEKDVNYTLFCSHTTACTL